jgi:hypothetical protein
MRDITITGAFPAGVSQASGSLLEGESVEGPTGTERSGQSLRSCGNILRIISPGQGIEPRSGLHRQVRCRQIPFQVQKPSNPSRHSAFPRSGLMYGFYHCQDRAVLRTSFALKNMDPLVLVPLIDERHVEGRLAALNTRTNQSK